MLASVLTFRMVLLESLSTQAFAMWWLQYRAPLPDLSPGMIEQLIDRPISPTEFDDLVMAFF
jgi:hypothetical protein